MLVKTFAFIIILTIFAPFYILLGLLTPAFSITNWIKLYASKLAVFPTVGVLILLAHWLLYIGVQVVIKAATDVFTGVALSQLFAIKTGTYVDLVQSQFNQGWPPLLGATADLAGLALSLASVAILFQTTKAAEMVEKLIAGQSFNFGSAIKEPISLGVTGGLTALGAYRAPEQAAFQQQLKEILEANPATYPGGAAAYAAARDRIMRRLRVSQASNQAVDLLKGLLK
jgi:hypothetical protein